MPSFNMFVYGSLDAFMGIFNAVAMVFNQSGFMNGVYLLGGLFMLVTVLVQAAGYMAQPAQIVRNIAIYATLISVGSIPTSLTIEDIYSGQMNKVDNVPMMLALPATVTSSALYGILNKTSTAYQGADSSYVSISTGGFMDPLKELLGMRSAIFGNRPLADTLRSFTLDCWNNATASGTVDELMKSDAGLEYLLTNGSVPAWTVNFINASNPKEGDSVVCADAAKKIWNEAGTFLSRPAGSSSPSLVDQIKKTVTAIGPRAGGGNPNLNTDRLMSNVKSTLDKLDAVGANSQNQMLTLLTASLLDDTFGCLQKSGGSSADAVNCATAKTMVVQAGEQWKADAAGNASFFQGIMLPASIFLQMLAIALFPLIFIVSVLSVGKAIQLMGSFVILLVWSMSWLPVAASIQWIMQMVLNADLRKFKTLNYENVFTFYNTLSTDLAIGADLMSATPLIALAVLIGSPFAFASMANRWSADRVNEKIASPDLQSPAAVQTMQTQRNYNPLAGGGTMPGYNQRSLSADSMNSQQAASSWSDLVRDARTLSQSNEKGSRAAGEFVKASGEVDKYAAGVAEDLSNKFSLSRGEKEAIQSDIKASMHAGLPIGPALDASISRNVSSDITRQAAADHVKKNLVSVERGESIEKKLSESLSNYHQASQGTGYQHGIERAKGYAETAARSSSTGASERISEEDFGTKFERLNPEQQAAVLQNLTQIRTMLARPENSAIARTVQPGHFGDAATRAAFGEIYAASRSGNASMQRLASDITNTLSGGVSATRFASDNAGMAAAPAPAPLWDPTKGAPTVGPVSAPGKDQVNVSNAETGRAATRQITSDSMRAAGEAHDQVSKPLTGLGATANVMTSGMARVGQDALNEFGRGNTGASIVGTDGKK